MEQIRKIWIWGILVGISAILNAQSPIMGRYIFRDSINSKMAFIDSELFLYKDSSYVYTITAPSINRTLRSVGKYKILSDSNFFLVPNIDSLNDFPIDVYMHRKYYGGCFSHNENPDTVICKEVDLLVPFQPVNYPECSKYFSYGMMINGDTTLMYDLGSSIDPVMRFGVFSNSICLPVEMTIDYIQFYKEFTVPIALSGSFSLYCKDYRIFSQRHYTSFISTLSVVTNDKYFCPSSLIWWRASTNTKECHRPLFFKDGAGDEPFTRLIKVE